MIRSIQYLDYEKLYLTQYPFHDNVIRNYGNIELFHINDDKQEDCLGWITIMEKCETNLRSLLKEGKLTFEERHKIARGIRSGMDYLYDNKMHNCDMKMENILMLDGVPKICDFGLVEDRNRRIATREMGYARKGSKYRFLPGLCKLIATVLPK